MEEEEEGVGTETASFLKQHLFHALKVGQALLSMLMGQWDRRCVPPVSRTIACRRIGTVWRLESVKQARGWNCDVKSGACKVNKPLLLAATTDAFVSACINRGSIE